MRINLDNIFSVDKIRGLKILEMFQYTAISVVITISVSYCINKSYEIFNHMLNHKNRRDMKRTEPDYGGIGVTISRLIMELFIIVLAYFYIRKIVLAVPSLAGMLYSKFRPNTTEQYTLDVALVMVLLELQPETRSRIDHIRYLLYGNEKLS
jgi:hypothetical protein